jgi:hypothetical protein
MQTAKLTALTATAAVALAGIAPATGLAKATGPGMHETNAKTYAFKEAGKRWDGTLSKGTHVKVIRVSKSGKWAYGFVNGQLNRRAWVAAADLDRDRPAKASAAKATGLGKHRVTKRNYVYVQAGKLFSGTMFKGETFDVKRLSPSGKWAYGFAYGHVNRKVWIDASVLAKK